ncbi:MAG: Uma2 family endonuclease [Solirubrobacteraceae bacterium]|jgi:Uma2 family endonuclease
MRTLLLDPPPAQLEEFLEQRRRTGTDLHDEVWEGVYHVIPVGGIAHSLIAAQLATLLGAPARTSGLVVSAEFNLGSNKDNYRVPDLGVHRNPQLAVWTPTAVIAVEVLSPDDDTWKKLPFYAQHEVDELLIVDPAERSVTWLALREGEYQPIERSEVLDLSASTLVEQIDWPGA